MIRFFLLQTSAPAAGAAADWLWPAIGAIAVVAVIVLFLKYREQISRFISEVRTELVKATWPWDPKEHGFKRYKELVDSTMVVVVAMLLLAGYVSFCDLALTSIIGVLTK